jgi:uncharacterized protein
MSRWPKNSSNRTFGFECIVARGRDAFAVLTDESGFVLTALFPRLELAKDANIAPDGHGFSGISLAYNTRNREDVDSVLAEAETAGAKIFKRAHEAFWGYSGYFSDPDGFLWEVAWNPSFQMEEDGSIRIPD